MVTCNVCGNENPPDALICANCYRPLVKLTNDSTIARPLTRRLNEESLLESRQVRHTGKLTAQEIAVYIGAMENPLMFMIHDQLLIGRYAQENTSQMILDLTPYAGFEKGVSRMHAMIRNTEGHLTLEDLDSRNGTWLNGTRLQPYIFSPLKATNSIKVAHLDLQIFWGGGE